MQIVIFGAFLLLMIVVGVIANQQQKKRMVALQAMSERLGLTFFEGGLDLPNSFGFEKLFGFNSLLDLSAAFPQNDLSAQFAGFFPLFSQGSSRRIQPVMTGQDHNGNYWYLFDYRYTISNGKSSSTYHFGVVVAQVPVMFPTMSLAPESVGYSIGKFLGMREMQVESEDFNQRYFIKTTDEKMSLDLLHPVAIETLLRQPVYEWQMSGPYVMLHLPGQIPPPAFESLMACINQFLAQVPNFYKQDHGTIGVRS